MSRHLLGTNGAYLHPSTTTGQKTVQKRRFGQKCGFPQSLADGKGLKKLNSCSIIFLVTLSFAVP